MRLNALRNTHPSVRGKKAGPTKDPSRGTLPYILVLNNG